MEPPTVFDLLALRLESRQIAFGGSDRVDPNIFPTAIAIMMQTAMITMMARRMKIEVMNI